MRIEASIDYWGDQVLTFDPEKVLDKLERHFPQVEIDPTDYGFQEVDRITQFVGEEFKWRSHMIESIRGKYRRNGPVYKFQLRLNKNLTFDGHAKRYSVTFRTEQVVDAESEKAVIEFLKSLKYGKICSDTKTENFSQPDENHPKHWHLAKSS